MPQGMEGTGALVVVLEEQALRLRSPEHLTCDRLIVALHQPAAHLVAPAQMESKRKLGMARHDCVVQFQAVVQPLLQGPATGLGEGTPTSVEQQGVVRSVEPD